MPSIQGFSAIVEEADSGTSFRFYGNRKRGNTLFTSIEAQDGVRFNIRIRPNSPFPRPRDAIIDGSTKHRYTLRSLKRRDTQDEMDCDESDPTPRRPYDFWAYIYLDGNSKYEDCSLIGTEPGHENYLPEGVVFKGRCHNVAKDDDPYGKNRSNSDMRSTFQIWPWLFKDKGIDVWLGHMNLSKDNAEPPTTDLDQDMADITEAIAKDNLTKAGCKRGQIEIVITREIQESVLRPKENPKPYVRDDLGDDEGSTHEVIADENNKQYCRSEVVKTRPYRPDEDFYCKISIAYHDMAKLRNLGLAKRDGSAIPSGHQRTLASSSSTESQTPLLKRLRDLDIEKSDNKISNTALSDEESAASDSTSNSDVPRHKRRFTRDIRKAKPRDKNKTSSWIARKAVEPTKQSMAAIESSGMSLPEFDFDLKGDMSEGSQLELQLADKQLQLAIADTETGTGTDGTLEGTEIVVASDEVVEVIDGEEIS